MINEKNFKEEFRLFNLKEMSRLTGISYNTLRNYKMGRTPVRREHLYLIRETLKKELLGGN